MTRKEHQGEPRPGAEPSPAGSGSQISGGPGIPLERQILEGVRRRDPEALVRFFEYYFDRIYGLAYRMLNDRTQAEDVTQEVYYRIHRAADRLDPDRDPTPWVTTLTLNFCRSIWRSSRHRADRKTVTLDDPDRVPIQPQAKTPDPAEALLAAERERVVSQVVRELPETLREVVLLRDYQGMDHQSIAEALGLGHDAVRKRYSRALAELGRMLKERLG